MEEGGSRDEIAVFYRTNAQSRVLEDMLVRYGVSYQVIGGTRFYERAEIKDALAGLNLLVNPQDLGLPADRQRSPPRHRPDVARPPGGPREHDRGVDLGRGDFAGFRPRAAAAATKAVERFMSVMVRLRERAEGGAAVGDLLKETLDETGYIAGLEERTIEAGGRLENLEELVGVAREYDSTAEEPSLEEFLQQVAPSPSRTRYRTTRAS